MAIIYSYPQINLSSISADDLMIISDMNADGRPTKSLTLKNLADFVTSTGTGTGTTNKIIKWADGPGGLLGDSIMTENATQIDLAGTFLSTSSPTATAGPVHAIRANQSTTTGGAFNIALYGDTKHTGATQANSNYGIYTKAEFEGTGGYTGIILGGTFEGRYDGSGTNGANASLYGTFSKANVTGASSGDIQYMIGSNVTSEMNSGTTTDVEFLQGQHTNVTLNSGNISGDIAVNILDFDYTAGTLQGDFAYLQIQNDPVPTPVSGTARAINSDSTLPSHFSGQVEVPLIPTSNPHATSKQYVDTQIASIPAGLVFKGNWDANANSPTLASGVGTVGNYYVVSVAGNTNLDGITDWEVGDWAVFVEVGGVDKWDKIDQTFVQGSGVSGNMTYWNGINSITYDASTPFVYTEVGGGGQPPGRLGLGTSSPNFKMDISGGDLRFEDNDGIRFGGTGSNNTNWRIYTTGSNSGTWKLAGGSDFVTVDRSATSAAATHGKVTFNKYGSGNFTGTALYNLSVDANGVIVETTGGGAGGPYLPLAGGTMTGDLKLNDNVKANFGASNDLQIYHNGSHSYIDDTGTGKLILRGNTDVEIHKYSGEYMITATADGAVSLYYDDVKKLETTSSGIDVTGDVTLSNGNALRWTSDDVRIEGTTAGDKIQFYVGNSEILKLEQLGPLSTFTSNLAVTGRMAINDGNDNVSIGDFAGDAITTGTRNVSVGISAGTQLSTGSDNILIGQSSGSASSAANKNVGIGPYSLQSLSYSGDSYNIAVGYHAGRLITTGTTNTLIGGLAGDALTTGSDNVAVGHGALTGQQSGNSNVAIGRNAMVQGTATDRNVAIGYFSLNNLSFVGDAYNVAVGYNAGLAVTTGVKNTLIGGLAGDALTTGEKNVAIGYNALTNEDEHGFNIAIGPDALRDQNAGANAYNVAIGASAGATITTGIYNTIVGGLAGNALTTGAGNTALGYGALSVEQAGGRNVAIGWKALVDQNVGSDAYNVAVGYQAGLSVSTGVYNTLLGGLAGDALTTGDENIAIGKSALSSEDTGSKSIAIGVNALTAQAAGGINVYNVAIGHNAGLSVTTGVENILIGGLAGDAITTAQYNVAVGHSSLSGNVQGWKNVAIGQNTLKNMNPASPTDTYNVAVGYEAGELITTGIQNTLIGGLAGDALTAGGNNVALGYKALSSEDIGNGSVAIGAFALEDQNSFASGIILNTAVGYEAGKNITGGAGTGDENTAIGGRSLDAETTGQENTAVGVEALGGQTGANKNTGLGWRAGRAISTGSNLTLLGYNAQSSTGTVSNEITLGDSNVTALRCAVTSITSLSDERDKSDIKDLTYGLELIDSLKPKEFVWDNRAEIDDEGNEFYSANKGKKDFGFIAQEVKELDDDTLRLIYDENPERLEMSYGKLVPILVKAIQELSAEVKILKNK